jgi:hypothetical protein
VARKIRHRFDPGPPTAGLLFLAAAGVFLACGLSQRPVMPMEILVAALLIGLGVVGIVQVLSRGRRRDP